MINVDEPDLEVGETDAAIRCDRCGTDLS